MWEMYLFRDSQQDVAARKQGSSKKNFKRIQSDKAETYKTLCPHWSSVRGIPECSVCIMEMGAVEEEEMLERTF